MRQNIRSFIAILFIINTLFISLHELMPHHNSSDCQVCTIVQHDNGLVPEADIVLIDVTPNYETPTLFYCHVSAFQTSARSTRAPPLFS